MNDTASIESVISAFYEILSGYKDQGRDWSRMRSLFVPGACLYPSSLLSGATFPSPIPIEAYLDRVRGFLSQHDFFESGSIQHIETYANIATVTSTYEARHTPEDAMPFKCGANYIHLLSDGKDWRIAGMIWKDEK